MASDKAFQDLPSFDARDYEPPDWATSSRFDWGKSKNGESSKGADKAGGDSPGDDADDDDEDDIFVDASEGESVPDLEDLEELKFSTAELKELLARANELKTKGNKKFTSTPADHGAAIDAYQSAIACLPPCPKAKSPETTAPPPPPTSGIQEVTDEEATAIEEEQKAALEVQEDPAVKERESVEEEIRQCTKACWGNMAASYLAQGDDKEAVRACTRALEIDPHYAKGLYRRASANDRMGTWTSLSSAKDDYTLFLTLVPRSSPQAILARKSLQTLPQRIQVQQEKEKDEMLGKLKDLGNGLLGKFGLSTDMFKFDQQEGGGYNLRFER